MARKLKLEIQRNAKFHLTFFSKYPRKYFVSSLVVSPPPLVYDTAIMQHCSTGVGGQRKIEQVVKDKTNEKETGREELMKQN